MSNSSSPPSATPNCATKATRNLARCNPQPPLTMKASPVSGSLSFRRIPPRIIARRRPGFGNRLCDDAGCRPKPEIGPASLQRPFRKPKNGLASLQGRFRDGFHIFASLQRRFRLGGDHLVGLRLTVAVGFGVAAAVGVGHRVLAEVFEVFLHPLHQVDGLAAVGVQ